jgi:hypothetical protein
MFILMLHVHVRNFGVLHVYVYAKRHCVYMDRYARVCGLEPRGLHVFLEYLLYYDDAQSIF